VSGKAGAERKRKQSACADDCTGVYRVVNVVYQTPMRIMDNPHLQHRLLWNNERSTFCGVAVTSS